MDYAKLKAELAEPAYVGLSDSEAADLLNAETETMLVEFVTGDAVFAAVDAGECKALSADDRTFFFAIIRMASVPIAHKLVSELFPEKSKSREALVAMQSRKVSRAEVLGLSFVYPGHMQNARM